MWVVIITSVIALLLSYSESKGHLKGGLKLGFILVTIIEAIHYNYGSDYMVYLEKYRLLVGNSVGFSSIFEDGVLGFEPGWSILYILMGLIFNGKDIGFFALVAILSIIQNTIYYNLIKKHVQKDYYFFSMFIYLFSAYELYLINMSMLRQGFTIALFVACFDLIRERKIIFAAIITVISFLIHKSAILMLPFVFWGFLPKSKSKLTAVAMGTLFFVFLLSYQTLGSALSILEEFAIVDNYLETYSSESSTFGLGFAIRLIPFLLYLIVLIRYREKISVDHFYLISLTAVGFIIEPFSSVAVLVARVTYYFIGLSVAAFPVALSYLRSSSCRVAIESLFIGFTVYTYYGFFTSSIIHKSYAVFHTIFEVL